MTPSPLLITDLVAELGVGQQVVLALSIGFAIWQLYRIVGVGRMIGGLIGQGMGYVMALGGFVAVGIALGWVNPLEMGADLTAAGDEIMVFVSRWGDDAVSWLVEALREVSTA